jgi:hypothetical protein
MSDQDLLPDLWGAVVDHDELIDVIIRHFGSAQQDADGAIVCPAADSCALRIVADRDRIGAITPGPTFDAAMFASLQEVVRSKLLPSTGDTIREAVLFSSRAVEGSYRHDRGQVEICPVPPNAPRANMLLADHPFLLKFVVRESSDWQITNLRAGREGTRWAWVLNALLRHRVRPGRPSSEGHWVLCDPEGDGPLQGRVKWAQDFYGFETPESAGAVPVVHPSLKMAADQDYYSHPYVTLTDSFDLPQSFGALIDRYLAQSIPDRDRFLRAAQWVAASDQLRSIHRGAWYLALSSAVETLAYDPEPKPDPCPSCGHDRSERPTRQFKDFLEIYATGPGHRAVIDRLYSVRSKLTHGTRGLHHDLPYQFTFKPALLDERADLDRMSGMVRVALVNWLSTRGPEIV